MNIQPIEVVLPGTPVTKKNSGVMVRPGLFVPSPAYTKWHDEQMAGKRELLATLKEMGYELPWCSPVKLKVDVYRSSTQGDLYGFVDAVSDLIQSSFYGCTNPQKVTVKVKGQPTKKNLCGKRTISDHQIERCPYCGWPAPALKRRGLGLILDDRLVMKDGGSELHVDKADPRCEVRIELVQGSIRVDLFQEDPEL